MRDLGNPSSTGILSVFSHTRTIQVHTKHCRGPALNHVIPSESPIDLKGLSPWRHLFSTFRSVLRSLKEI